MLLLVVSTALYTSKRIFIIDILWQQFMSAPSVPYPLSWRLCSRHDNWETVLEFVWELNVGLWKYCGLIKTICCWWSPSWKSNICFQTQARHVSAPFVYGHSQLWLPWKVCLQDICGPQGTHGFLSTGFLYKPSWSQSYYPLLVLVSFSVFVVVVVSLTQTSIIYVEGISIEKGPSKTDIFLISDWYSRIQTTVTPRHVVLGGKEKQVGVGTSQGAMFLQSLCSCLTCLPWLPLRGPLKLCDEWFPFLYKLLWVLVYITAIEGQTGCHLLFLIMLLTHWLGLLVPLQWGMATKVPRHEICMENLFDYFWGPWLVMAEDILSSDGLSSILPLKWVTLKEWFCIRGKYGGHSWFMALP